jgi:hypothetical protein
MKATVMLILKEFLALFRNSYIADSPFRLACSLSNSPFAWFSLPVDHSFIAQQFVESVFSARRGDPSWHPFPGYSMVQTPSLLDRLFLIAGARDYRSRVNTADGTVAPPAACVDCNTGICYLADDSFGRAFLFPFLPSLRNRSCFLLVPDLHKGRLEIIR